MDFFRRIFGLKDPMIAALEDLSSSDTGKREAAAENLVNLGLTAVPIMIKLVEDRQLETQWEAAQQAIKSLGLQMDIIIHDAISDLNSGDPNRKKRADGLLKRMKPEGRRVVFDLAKLQKITSQNIERKKEVLRILGKIGAKGLGLEFITPILIWSLASSDVGGTASEALAIIGRPALKALAEALNSKDASSRKNASLALKAMGPNAEEVMSSLINALSDPDREVRQNAVDALSNLSGQAKQVIPLLMDAFGKDETLKVREALMKIGIFDVESVAKGLEHSSQKVCYLTAQVLHGFGPSAKVVLPALLKALKTGFYDVKIEVAATISALKPQEDAVPFLIDALSDGNLKVGDSVTGTLAEIGAPAIPALVKALRDENNNVKERAAQALGKMGPVSVTAVPALITALKDVNAQLTATKTTTSDLGTSRLMRVEQSAIKALGDIGPMAKEAVPVLVDLLKSENMTLRNAAVISLGKIGDAQAVSPLLEYLFEFPRESGYDSLEKALLSIVPNSTLTEEIVRNAVKSSTYDHIFSGYEHDAGKISLVASQRAVESICRIKSQITSNILHLVAKKRNISVTMDTGCSAPWEELVNFETQRQMALDELANRGSPPYDPEAFLKLPEKESELIKMQSDREKSQRELMEFQDLVSRVEGTGEASLKAAKQLASGFKSREAFHVIAVKLSKYRYISPNELYSLTDCLVTIAKEIKQQAIPELTIVMDSWPSAAARVLGSLDIPEVVSPLRRLLEHPNDAVANSAVSALGDYVKRTRDPNAIEALKWAAKRVKPSPDGRVAGRYEWAEHYLKEIGA